MRNQKPEVYALHQEGKDWRITRRDFLKAAGIGAAVLGSGSGCLRTAAASGDESFFDACNSVPAHKDNIKNILTTPDDKYMVTCSEETIKCWDLEDEYKFLGRVKVNHLSSIEKTMIGRISGESCLIGKGKYQEDVLYCELPILSSSVFRNLPFADDYQAFAVDSSGNFYGASKHRLFYYSADKEYKEEELLYVFETETRVESFCLICQDSKVFIQFKNGNSYGILDLTDRTLKMFSGKCSLYSVSSDGARALIYDDKKNTAGIIELNEGTDVGTIDFGQRGSTVNGIALSKDGEKGFLVERRNNAAGVLLMVSMTDGTVLGSLDLCTIGSERSPLSVTADGKRIIAGVDSSVFVINVPDLRIAALPTDLDEVIPDTEGCVVQMTDPDSGVVYTQILARGADIPKGAVCVCNTVTGRAHHCDMYCTCDTNSRPHYWHPN